MIRLYPERVAIDVLHVEFNVGVSTEPGDGSHHFRLGKLDVEIEIISLDRLDLEETYEIKILGERWSEIQLMKEEFNGKIYGYFAKVFGVFP